MNRFLYALVWAFGKENPDRSYQAQIDPIAAARLIRMGLDYGRSKGLVPYKKDMVRELRHACGLSLGDARKLLTRVLEE